MSSYRSTWKPIAPAATAAAVLLLTAAVAHARQAPAPAGAAPSQAALSAGATVENVPLTPGGAKEDKAEQSRPGVAPQPTVPRPAGPKQPPSKVARWLDVQTASVSMRYRYLETSKDLVTARQMQDAGTLKARFKFDAAGKYSVTGAVATGSSFTGGWNTTGVGTGPYVGDISVKHLFASAAPAKGLEFSVGSMALARGESTEVTSYDNDGYVAGERVTVKRPKDLYLDEVSATVAYLGDISKPSFFDRADRMGDWNYWQVLAAKKLGKQAVVSTDLTRLDGVQTLRSALSAKTPAFRVVDLVRWEQYRRFGDTAAWGFSAYAEKALHKRVTVGGGYADIDAKYGGLNADRFNKGRRLFTSGAVKVVKDLQVQYFLTQAVHNDFAVSNKTRFDLALAYNAAPVLSKVLFSR